MRPPATWYLPMQRLRTSRWRAAIVRLVALAIAFNFVVTPMADHAAGAVAGEPNPVAVAFDQTTDLPPDDRGNYLPVGHSIHSIEHLTATTNADAVAIEPLRIARQVDYPEYDNLGSPSNVSPPRKPPRA